MTSKPAHKPAGTSDGGQFAKTSHGEATIALTVPDIDDQRSVLVGQRRELDARIGAMDVTAAAAAIRARFPDAAAVTAWRSSEQVFNTDELTVRVTAVDGLKLWEGPRESLPELGTLSLVPDQYQRQDSPLRTSSVRHFNHTWRSYSLDKMAAVTAEQLMEEA